MKSSLKNRILLVIFAVMTVLFGAVLTTFYIEVSTDVVKDEYYSGEAAGSFADVVINGDRAKYYVTSRKTDGEYHDVLRSLIEYTQDSRISRISVISYGSTVGYYIYDTDGKTLGTKVSYDDFTTEKKAALIECRDTWNITRGSINYSYRPIRTSDDMAVAYIIVESPVVNGNLPSVLVKTGLVSLLIIAGVSFGLMYFIYRTVIKPVEQYTRDISGFAGSDSKVSEEEIISKFETGRTDEIGQLSQAVISMIRVINHSRDDISTAIFDATHDGMTKTFNKRHYENKMPGFRNCSSILVVYFDVNNLKLINDTLGHERGDYVIKRAAEYISEISFSDSMCFRMGGDEFLLVAANHSYKEMQSLVDRIEADCPVILSADTDSVKCSVAYGFAYAKGGYVYEDLLSEAEENMYRKKYEIKQQLNMPDR